MAAAALVGLEGYVEFNRPLEASSRLSSCAFIENSLLHSSVEVNKNVEFNRPSDVR